jgi:hypothetical protein
MFIYSVDFTGQLRELQQSYLEQLRPAWTPRQWESRHFAIQVRRKHVSPGQPAALNRPSESDIGHLRLNLFHSSKILQPAIIVLCRDSPLTGNEGMLVSRSTRAKSTQNLANHELIVFLTCPTGFGDVNLLQWELGVFGMRVLQDVNDLPHDCFGDHPPIASIGSVRLLQRA